MSTPRMVLQYLADARIREAEILLSHHCWDGAYYLAGYAVEAALKACYIRHQAGKDTLPEKNLHQTLYTHDLDILFATADLKNLRIQDEAANPVFQVYWQTVKRWSEQSRYMQIPEQSARDLVEATNHPQDGVLTWIKLRW